MMMSGGSGTNKPQGDPSKATSQPDTVKPQPPKDEIPATVRERLMANIPPFQRPLFDVVKAWYAAGVQKYVLVDRATGQHVKYNNSGVST
jgi:hypothetical protein